MTDLIALLSILTSVVSSVPLRHFNIYEVFPTVLKTSDFLSVNLVSIRPTTSKSSRNPNPASRSEFRIGQILPVESDSDLSSKLSQRSVGSFKIEPDLSSKSSLHVYFHPSVHLGLINFIIIVSELKINAWLLACPITSARVSLVLSALHRVVSSLQGFHRRGHKSPLDHRNLL